MKTKIKIIFNVNKNLIMIFKLIIILNILIILKLVVL